MSTHATDRARPGDAAARLPDDWIVPAWPAPSNVHALFTTRNVDTGGIRTTAFDVGGARAPDDSRERAPIADHR